MAKHCFKDDVRDFFKDFFVDLEKCKGNLKKEEAIIIRFLVENF